MTQPAFSFEPYRVDASRGLVDLRIMVDGTYTGHVTLRFEDWLAFTAALAFGQPVIDMSFPRVESTLTAVRHNIQSGGI